MNAIRLSPFRRYVHVGLTLCLRINQVKDLYTRATGVADNLRKQTGLGLNDSQFSTIDGTWKP